MLRWAVWLVFAVLPGLAGWAEVWPATEGVTGPATMSVETESGVRIEVLDWGGSGPPLVLLAGLGGEAKGFDSFARALEPRFHVYAISRRGYGGSSAPLPGEETYSADRLGDNVLAVLDKLQLRKPLLVGFSLGGEELSSIGSRRPERVAGLVYLDAGYRYALSRPGMGDLQLDVISMRRYLQTALDGLTADEEKVAVDAFLRELPEFEKELTDFSASLGRAPKAGEAEVAKARAERGTPEGRAERAILDGEQRYGTIQCPVLAIFAYPHELPKEVTGAARTEAERRDTEFVDQRVKLFRALPDAKVVLLPHATHAVQDSRRPEVLREVEAFAARVRR